MSSSFLIASVGSHLTLTRVVFEFIIGGRPAMGKTDLTLTRVVFE